MGQSGIMEFLKKYKHSKEYKKKKWLSTREIYEKMKGTKEGSQFSSITTSLKKLRETGMVYARQLPVKRNARYLWHYQLK